MTGDKWMTSGANRLKSRMNRTFERRASLDGQISSPRISGSYAPSTTAKKHPNFVKRNIRGLTGTFTKVADPVYRRGILPSSPRRAPLHEENEYPTGAILPRDDRDIRTPVYQQMPYSVNGAASYPYDPYLDQRERSPHQHLQSQNIVVSEPRRHVVHGYEPNFATGSQHFIQQAGPPYKAFSHLQDSTSCQDQNASHYRDSQSASYQEQNASHYRDSQPGDQSEYRSREHFVQHASLRARHFDSFSNYHDQAEIASTPQCSTYGDVSQQLTQMPGQSERGILQFRNANRNRTFDQSAAWPWSNFSQDAFHDERQVLPRRSLRQHSIDAMTNRNSLGAYSNAMIDQNVDFHAPIEPSVHERLSTGHSLSYNGENLDHNERNDSCERRTFDQKKPLLDLLRQNQDFGVEMQATDFPKGIDRFKSKAQPDEESKIEADASRRAEEGTQGNATLEKNPITFFSSNSKRPLKDASTIDANTAKGAEDESAESDSKRLRVDSARCNAQKENVSPLSGDEPRSIGSALMIQFFDGNLEVDVCGRPLNAKQNSRHSNQNQPPNFGTDSPGIMGWDNESSLWRG